MEDEQVDILEPPFFTPTGKVKPIEQALDDSDWIGTFNLWIVANNGVPSIIYQQRTFDRNWAPGLLDVAAAGHYQTGEKLADGLREVKEELGKDYNPQEMIYLGRKLYVGKDTQGRCHNNVVEVYLHEDNDPLESFTLQAEEVRGICACPIAELLRAHRDESYSFTVTLSTATGTQEQLTVSKKSFPENWDNYHYKIAILADRYYKGDRDLLY